MNLNRSAARHIDCDLPDRERVLARRFSAHFPSAINNCAGPMCRKQYFTRFNPPVTAAISGPAVNCRLSQLGKPGKDEVSDAVRDNNALRFATVAIGFRKKTID